MTCEHECDDCKPISGLATAYDDLGTALALLPSGPEAYAQFLRDEQASLMVDAMDPAQDDGNFLPVARVWAALAVVADEVAGLREATREGGAS